MSPTMPLNPPMQNSPSNPVPVAPIAPPALTPGQELGMGPYLSKKGLTQVLPLGSRKKYRVLFGVHFEPIPGEVVDYEAGTGFRMYRKDDTFESHIDYDRWSTKLVNVSQEGVGSNVQMWDSTKETIEQFVTRMTEAGKTNGLTPPSQAPTEVVGTKPPSGPQEAPLGQKFDGTNDDTYAAMTDDELKRFAQTEGISTRGCRNREDLLRVIKAHRPQ